MHSTQADSTIPTDLTGDSTANAQEPAPVFAVSRRTGLYMVLLNWLPVMHVALVAVAAWLGASWSVPAAIGAGLIALYLFPPLLVRLVLTVRPITEGKYDLDSGAFRTWWFTAQCQIVFNRLPILEEVLRLLPCAYSLWLRLWGAKVGWMVFWSPGTTVLDRPFVQIGDGCVMGLGVRLHPHLIAQSENEPKKTELWLAPVRIGEQSLIGGFSLLAPGVTVTPRSMTPAIHALPAFSEWRTDRRTRRARPTMV